ncbi:virion structural protein [Acaryochloris phage A-HIS1]|nr:virion structural protein [Acaryochloris phage A-HIS1]
MVLDAIPYDIRSRFVVSAYKAKHMTIYTGFINGSVTFDNAGTPTLLPFDDLIMSASVEFTGEVLFAETFAANGLKGKSRACPFRQAVTVTLESEDISWSFLQASLGTLSTTRTDPLPITETLTAVDNAGMIQITLSQTPSTGTAQVYANLDGDQFTGTLAANVVTFAAGVAAGDRITAGYFFDAPADTDEIAFGQTDVISSFGLYGVFKGCPDDLIFVAENAVLSPNVSLSVDEDPAVAGMTLDCVRGSDGVYARLIRSA